MLHGWRRCLASDLFVEGGQRRCLLRAGTRASAALRDLGADKSARKYLVSLARNSAPTKRETERDRETERQRGREGNREQKGRSCALRETVGTFFFSFHPSSTAQTIGGGRFDSTRNRRFSWRATRGKQTAQCRGRPTSAACAASTATRRAKRRAPLKARCTRTRAAAGDARAKKSVFFGGRCRLTVDTSHAATAHTHTHTTPRRKGARASASTGRRVSFAEQKKVRYGREPPPPLGFALGPEKAREI